MKSLITSILQFVHRLRHGITLSNAKFDQQVERVNQAAAQVESLNDTDLQVLFDDIKQESRGTTLAGDKLVLAFAVVREAAARSLSMHPYDVQMLAAFAMFDGKCVEMQTGEGKTLAAALVMCVKAISLPAEASSLHVLTFNDYLAERDAAWMKPLYEFFDLSVGHVVQGMPTAERIAAYRRDITYITAKEAGFDFLRDQLCLQSKERVQGGHHFAIVDEADSILVDEARIPLVIATEDEADSQDLSRFAKLAGILRKPEHFEIKSSGRNVSLTDDGLEFSEIQLGVDELHSEQHAETLARLNLALQAQVLLHRDVDYIIRGDRLELIDEFTGRVAENRKWPGGLQAALEAKEGLPIQPQGRILNSITLQHFLARYNSLAGMTGTAVEATEELNEFYRLQIVIIPPNRPCVREDHDDVIFDTRDEKYRAITDDVLQQHRHARPVLIGTASVEESELLAEYLGAAGITCRVLNAANDHLEADIIAEAGAAAAVTISTNMAGRGTDICLGGSDGRERAAVVKAGGLYVIGTNRHESRRIDNQLRGRSGRQGDPGESRFYVSLQDDLIARHGIGGLFASPQTESQPLSPAEKSRRIAHIQRIIEGESFEVRKTLRMYSQLLEVQRQSISRDREALLQGTRTPQALEKHDPELREQLLHKWGESIVNDAERRVTLIHLDWCWSDHLAHAGEIRHSVHLVSWGGFNPSDYFNREMRMEFDAFRTLVEERVVETLRKATFTKDGIDLDKEGLRGPSSTWTFTINDNPRGAIMGVLIRGVVNRLRNLFSG